MFLELFWHSRRHAEKFENHRSAPDRVDTEGSFTGDEAARA
jgi:hypothetical protein